MIPRILTALVAVASALLVSCSPYPEHKPNQQKPPAKLTPAQVAQAEQAKREAQREEARRAADDEKKMQAQLNEQPNNEVIRDPGDLPSDPGEKKSDPFKPGEYDFAKKAPGREGFVLSPYNNKIIDIRDLKTGKPYPRGTLVSDPTYPASEKKYFRVP